MTDVQTYKNRLEEERAALQAQLSTIGEPDPAQPNAWEGIQRDTEPEADPNDQASHLDEYQENRAVIGVLGPRYEEVVAALDRIENGTFGVCSECGAAIEEDRLNADPAAKTCIAHVNA